MTADDAAHEIVERYKAAVSEHCALRAQTMKAHYILAAQGLSWGLAGGFRVLGLMMPLGHICLAVAACMALTQALELARLEVRRACVDGVLEQTLAELRVYARIPEAEQWSDEKPKTKSLSIEIPLLIAAATVDVALIAFWWTP